MSGGGGTCRILVVEDDPLSRNALIWLLRHAGHEVTGARTLSEALGALDGQTHVITDLVLSGGVSALKLLEQTRFRGQRLKIAVVTSLERDDELVCSAARYEPHLILRKPIDVDALLQWVTQSPA